MRRLIKAAPPPPVLVLLRALARALAEVPWLRWLVSGGRERGPRRRRARLSSLRAAGSAELRLVGGGGRCAGRVEVKHDGEWGSVCAFDFDWEARWAVVVCRQLGCGRVARASLHAPFGPGSGRIWLQPFFCRGTEDALEQCPNIGWGRHFCGHEWDVGVTCTDAVELRLAGGSSPCAGRVEVKLQGHWGTVGDDSWDMADAEVVCQQLGCGSASIAYYTHERFGVGDGLVSLALVNCSGAEATLWNCEIRGWGPYNSSIHGLNAAVVCQGFSRLVGGDGACAGRLEVRQGRAWVGVCEDEVDMKAAQVVCRELGCGEVIAIAGSGRFGAVSGSLWVGGFRCNGTEPLLSACARRPAQRQECSGPASVICSSYTGFRLGNGSSGCAGRVEVAVRGTWGSVCASEWDLPDAHVLCRHLGCGRAFSVPPGGSFGSGEGPLLPDAFGCSGSERHPGQCPVAVLGKPPCAPGNAAAVNCSGAVESLRLVKGETRCEGFLEYNTSTGAWHRVPGEVSLLRNLSNVCWKLGCGELEKSHGVPGEVYLWQDNKNWGILKTVIKDIVEMTTDLASRTISEDHFRDDYGLMTTGPADIPHGTYLVCSSSLQVRLVGSSGRCAGRVEVYSGGSWSWVCQEGWGLQAAAVVCRELGCGTALQAPGWARLGAGAGPLWPYSPDCSGSEESLWECGRTERRECGRGGGAGAVCSEQLSVRLAGGPGRCRGFLEISYNGTWGRVCANGTSPSTASTVCRQLGCGQRGWLTAVTAQEPTEAWLAWVGCGEGARSLWQCPSAAWHLQSCRPGGDAYVECEEDSDGTTEGHTTPYPEGASSTGVPRRRPPAVAVGSVPVPTVLCVVLGTLLCLCLGALALLLCRARARRRGPGRAADAISNAVYEELDYKAMPEYQEVPTPPGSLLEGWVKKLPYYTGDSVEGSDTEAAPDPPAWREQGPPDGYDDVLAVPQEPPAASTGDISEGVAGQRWSCVLPTGPAGASRDPSEQPPGHMDYDDVGSSALGTLMGGLLKEGSAFVPPGSSPRWQGSRAMALACGTSCSRRFPMFRPGCRARRASSSFLQQGLAESVRAQPGRGGGRSRGVGACGEGGAEGAAVPVRPCLSRSLRCPARACRTWKGPGQGPDSPQAPQRAGGMPELLAELQDALGSQLVVTQVQAGCGLEPVLAIRVALGRLQQQRWSRGGCRRGPRRAGAVGGLSPPGDIRVAAHCGERCRGCAGWVPVAMGPLLALGLLVCVRLCGGECRAGGSGARGGGGRRARLSSLRAAGSGELRLVGGGGRCAGRVEVKHDGEWGSVCAFDFDWEARWAVVVCRQLGCGRVARASLHAPFGPGSGRIWLQPFFCRGTEDALEQCSHLGWGRHFCGHEWDVGVTCTDAVELRLAGGGSPCAGRVEVKLQGHWGTVGDHSWDMEDAEVVCQQLGCGSASIAYYTHERFGVGDGLISLALVNCSGDEATLWNCEIRGWGPYNSSINVSDVGVVCQGFSRLVGGDGACAGRLEVRQGRAWVGVCEDEVDMKAAQVVCRELGCGEVIAIAGSGRFGAVSGSLWVGGFRCNGTEPLLSACARRPAQRQECSGPASVICSSYTGFRLGDGSSGCAGRVEVAVRGTWGSVCASEWDLPDAHVLCRHLGCGRAFSVPPGGSFGSGEGPLLPDAFGCSGSERHPGQCPVAVLGKPPCAPGNAAAVNCSGAVESLRLVKGETRCEGFLEYNTSTGAWHRVPGEVSLLRNLSNVCWKLDCGELEKSHGVPGEVYLLRDNKWGILKTVIKAIVEMTTDLASRTISENYFLNDYRLMTTGPADIPHGTYLVCSGSLQVRLVGSSGRCAGRVEVYSGGSWSWVCQEGWGLQAADVVCRELGCGTALQAPGWARLGAGAGPLWPYSPDCSGSEESLWECGRTERRECGRGGGAGAVCSEQLSVRLAGGPGRCRGFLEMFQNSTWGRVCANGTSNGTAAAVCRLLGCGELGELSAVSAQESTEAWLAWVGCEDGARSLWQCPSAAWHLQSCGTNEHAYVDCEEDSGGTTEGHTTPYPEGASSTGVPRRRPPAVAVGSVPVPTVLCVVLGTLLCLSLGALALLLCRARARRRGPGRAADAISNAVYEELDYKAMPEYQEVPTPPGSLLEGWVKKLPYYTGDSVEGSDTEAAPDPPAWREQGPPDGYDDVLAVPQEPPAASTGDISEGVARQGWSCVLPTGPTGASRDPSEQPPGHMDYDDVGSSALGTMGGLLKEGSAFVPPGSSPRWQGSRAMALACGTSCSRRFPMFRPGCRARRASSSFLQQGLAESVRAQPGRGGGRSRGVGACGEGGAEGAAVPVRPCLSRSLRCPARACRTWKGPGQGPDSPQAPQRAGGMPELLAELQDALGSQLVVTQVQAVSGGRERGPRRRRARLSSLRAAGSGELRLVGGGGRCAGRVEVKHDGEWGSVCAFDFYWEALGAPLAVVVCRQLGCGRVARVSLHAPFGPGSGRIWLQPFFCRGTEDALEQCWHLGWGRHFCGHEWDVGVTCTDAVELRLAGGGSPCAGRVEVKLQGHWGSVADDKWDMEDAKVVCQQLGCGSASGAFFALDRFGVGVGPISLAAVDCRGDEAMLWDCKIRGWGPYNITIHDSDTAVVCQGFSRLVGGDGACAGRLEVRQGQAWVGVCEDEVDMKAAQVVCRELGCGEVNAIAGSGRFRAVSGSLWVGGFRCNGTEPLLSACARRPAQRQECSGPASVICSSYTGFRLGDGSSGCAGRVEVAVRGTWGSVCASEWDLPDAHVLCRHLGCGRAFSVPPGGSFGSGEGPLLPDAFGCSGSERHPGQCPVAVLGKPPCAPRNAAAVNCSGFVTSLRLVDGQSLCDGRLEETITSPAWRRVPLEQWNQWDAYMVCAVLGCGLPKDVYAALGTAPALSSSPSEEDIMSEEMGSSLGMGSALSSSPEEMDDQLEEMGNVSGMGPAANSSLEEMVIVCSGSLRVRLVGSSGRCAGRVEVYSGGSWSWVCQEGWGLQAAAVVCRELGCGTALQAPGWARLGAGAGPLWPYSPDCSGSEESLWECGRTERRECGRGGGAGAVCSEQLSVRLAGGPGRCRGFLEISYNGTWGCVCANGTSPSTASTVCRQLGCGQRGWLTAVTAQEPTEAWLAWVGCEDGARSLWQCPSAAWHLQSCRPGGDAYVECEEDSDGTTEGHTTPYPEGVPRRRPPAVARGSVPVPTVLCVVLGTLLCLSLGALALLLCRARARRRGPGRAVDAISNAVYEELDYKAIPEYQEVPTPPGSLLEGWVKKLPYYTGDSVEGSDTEAAPDPPAWREQGPPDGYDDVLAVPQEPPAASTGDISEGVAGQRWSCVLPTGGIYSPPGPPGASREPSEQPPGHMDYDDVGSSALGILP
uniref:uncharacterized protein LOC129121822 n=1 Tax=Agelaius phoeniceus TaxID=39638 RepID=UPI0023EC90EA|nr:uncharacterized protein LOC129121822 [Agelaius phoeniceus]